jgi:DNA-binding MarR family transcriptional regulator
LTPKELSESMGAALCLMYRRLGAPQHSMSLLTRALLWNLHACGPLTMARIAAESGASPHAVSRSVESLRVLGLVEVSTTDEDRRQKLVRLTRGGELATEAAARECLRLYRERGIVKRVTKK